jgi:hypothetical protein
MNHQLIDHLPVLPELLPNGTKIDFVIATNHEPVIPEGRIASFGIVMKTPSMDIAFGWYSDTTDSDNARAGLAAVLTAMEWLPKICSDSAVVGIHTKDEPLYKYLLPGLAVGLEGSKRANPDLLAKIKHALGNAGVVTIVRLDGKIFVHEQRMAKRFAAKALEQKRLLLAGQK